MEQGQRGPTGCKKKAVDLYLEHRRDPGVMGDCLHQLFSGSVESEEMPLAGAIMLAEALVLVSKFMSGEK